MKTDDKWDPDSKIQGSTWNETLLIKLFLNNKLI